MTDCSAVVLDGVWPAELITPSPATESMVRHLREDLARIVAKTNERLADLRHLNLPAPQHQAVESRYLSVARSMAVLRVESSVRQISPHSILAGPGMSEFMRPRLPRRERPAVLDRPIPLPPEAEPDQGTVEFQSLHPRVQNPGGPDMRVAGLAPASNGGRAGNAPVWGVPDDQDRRPAQAVVEPARFVAPEPEPVRFTAPVLAPAASWLDEPAAAETTGPIGVPEPDEGAVPDDERVVSEAPPQPVVDEPPVSEATALFEGDAPRWGMLSPPVASESVAPRTARHARPDEDDAAPAGAGQWWDEPTAPDEPVVFDEPTPEESLPPVIDSVASDPSFGADDDTGMPLNGNDIADGAGPGRDVSGDGGARGPAVPETQPAPAPLPGREIPAFAPLPSRPPAHSPRVAAHPAAVDLRQIVAGLARQAPGVSWLAARRPDGAVVVATDVLWGWIPAGVAVPVGVEVLAPEHRSGPMRDWLGPVAEVAEYVPGQRIEFGSPAAQLSEEPFAVVGWDGGLAGRLAEATRLHEGLPRLVAVLAGSGTAARPEEVDILRVHVETGVQSLLDQYPDVSAQLGLSCMLMAATEALASGHEVLAAYHHGWYEGIVGRGGQ